MAILGIASKFWAGAQTTCQRTPGLGRPRKYRRSGRGRGRGDSVWTMRRISQLVGAVFLLLGVFWAGREGDHGLTAFWEHWWCPLPLALILTGLAAVLVTRRRPSPSA
jgi:hypothetical protein